MVVLADGEGLTGVGFEYDTIVGMDMFAGGTHATDGGELVICEFAAADDTAAEAEEIDGGEEIDSMLAFTDET